MKSVAGYLIIAVAFALVCSIPLAGAAEQKTVKEFTATIDPDGVQRVEILGGGYFFDPNYVIVKVNVPVELKVRKESGFVPHDIVMKAPEAGIDFAEDLSTTPKTITFTPTKVGKYPFHCSKKLPFFASHQEKGMEGTLDVRE